MVLVGVPALVGGWFLARKGVGELVAQRAEPAPVAAAADPAATVRVLDEPEDKQ